MSQCGRSQVRVQRSGARAGVRGLIFIVSGIRLRSISAGMGNPWSLQMMLGHAMLVMVENFLVLAKADLQKNLRIAGRPPFAA